MDVHISGEAEAGLRAEVLVTPPDRRRGVLLGHKRGPRYFVARIFPLGGRSFPGASRLREVDKLFDGKILGFYAARDPAPGPSGILRPFACGKLFLRVPGAAGAFERLDVKSSVIEYDGCFYLSPISLARRRS